MLIFRPICTSTRENTKTTCCTAQTCFGPSEDHEIAPVYGDHIFKNLQLCYCLWVSSLSQKGADGRNAIPEPNALSPQAQFLCPAEPCPGIPKPNTGHSKTVYIVQWREWLEEHLCRREWMRFFFMLCGLKHLKFCSAVIFNNQFYLGSDVFIQSLLDFN